MNDYKLKIGELRSYMESLLQVSGNLAPRKVGRRKNFNLREVFGFYERSFYEKFFWELFSDPIIGSKIWKLAPKMAPKTENRLQSVATGCQVATNFPCVIIKVIKYT